MQSIIPIKTIYPFDKIGDSLVNINENFSNLDGLVTVISDEHSRIVNTEQLLSDSVKEIDYNFYRNHLATTACIRLSLHPTFSCTNFSNTKKTLVKKTELFLHEFRGNGIALYNTSKAAWEPHATPRTKGFSLKDLTPSTCYDIYIYIDYSARSTAGTSILKLYFEPWVNSSTPSSRGYINGIAVLSSDVSKRFIGCIYIQADGTTEQTYGDISEGGGGLKQLVWNYYNRIDASIKSVDTYLYTITRPMKDVLDPFKVTATGDTYWCRSNENHKTQGLNNKITFLCGEPSPIMAFYKNTAKCVNSRVYTGISLNSSTMSKTSPAFYAKDDNEINTLASIKQVAPIGLNTMQIFDAADDVTILNTRKNSTLEMEYQN